MRLGEVERVQREMQELNMHPNMQQRYKDLFEMAEQGQNVEDRINVVKRMLVIRRRVYNLLQGYGASYFGKANVTFGVVRFRNPITNQDEILRLLSYSGDKTGRFLAERNLRQVDDWLVVPNAPAPIPPLDFSQRWFQPLANNPLRAQDAEAKIFEFIRDEINRRTNIDLRAIRQSNRQIPSSLNLQIEIITEMRPCNSCGNIINEYNGMTNQQVTLRFGTEYNDTAIYNE